jgi:type I restriction enzyme S subunit
MKSNYEALGKHIRLVDYRNSEEVTSTVLGISIDKEFMPSVANVIGTDLSRYKLISKGLFACNPMHVGRDERLHCMRMKNRRLFPRRTSCLKL